jgi:CBS domain-containing protein
MLASDLQVSLPVMNRKTSAVVAARLIARQHASGFIVTDDDGTPMAEISSADVLALLLPSRLLADATLARALDDAASDDVWTNAGDHTIGELLDDESAMREILHVDGDAPLAEVAALMIGANSQIAVVDGDTLGPRFITLPAVVDAILVVSGDGGPST